MKALSFFFAALLPLGCGPGPSAADLEPQLPYWLGASPGPGGTMGPTDSAVVSVLWVELAERRPELRIGRIGEVILFDGQPLDRPTQITSTRDHPPTIWTIDILPQPPFPRGEHRLKVYPLVEDVPVDSFEWRFFVR